MAFHYMNILNLFTNVFIDGHLSYFQFFNILCEDVGNILYNSFCGCVLSFILGSA